MAYTAQMAILALFFGRPIRKKAQVPKRKNEKTREDLKKCRWCGKMRIAQKRKPQQRQNDRVKGEQKEAKEEEETSIWCYNLFVPSEKDK